MSSLRALQISAEERELHRGRLLGHSAAVIPILGADVWVQTLCALGIQQEIGGVNDELAQFLYDAERGTVVARDRIRAELVEQAGRPGVRIWVEGHERLELRLRGLRELIHPMHSVTAQGEVRQLVVFPESLARIAALQGIELVVVREWALNTVFGGFDPTRPFYETNAWELVHHDALRYSQLLSERRIALIGTHDLVAHLAGARREAMDALERKGRDANARFARYFGPGRRSRHSIHALIAPYAAGVLLDDLAQPRNYGSLGRDLVFERVMALLDDRVIDPEELRTLARFPDAYVQLIQLARSLDVERIRLEVDALCAKLVRELSAHSVLKTTG